MKSRLAVSDALYLRPLIFGLDRTDSPFELVNDIPAKNALKLNERSGEIKNAFLTPIDYARHGAEYCIVPGICVSSSQKTGIVELVIKSSLKNIERIAVDIRYTSEIILANIILKEKYRNESSHQKHQFIPMLADLNAMLAKADAALIINDVKSQSKPPDTYTLDLVEEWNDMTELPYVFGFWVGREEETSEDEAKALIKAKKEGAILQDQIAQDIARQRGMPIADLTRYFSSFSYELGNLQEESLAEYMHYAYYHGIIGDVPEIRFFDVEPEK